MKNIKELNKIADNAFKTYWNSKDAINETAKAENRGKWIDTGMGMLFEPSYNVGERTALDALYKTYVEANEAVTVAKRENRIEKFAETAKSLGMTEDELKERKRLTSNIKRNETFIRNTRKTIERLEAEIAEAEEKILLYKEQLNA